MWGGGGGGGGGGVGQVKGHVDLARNVWKYPTNGNGKDLGITKAT